MGANGTVLSNEFYGHFSIFAAIVLLIIGYMYNYNKQAVFAGEWFSVLGTRRLKS